MASSLMAPSGPPSGMLQSQWRAQSVELPVAGRSVPSTLSRRPGSTISRGRAASGNSLQRPSSVQSCLSPRQIQAPSSSQRMTEVVIATPSSTPATPSGTPSVAPPTTVLQASAIGSPMGPRRMQSRPLRPNLRSSVPCLSQQQAPLSARQDRLCTLSSRVASATALTPQKVHVTAPYPVSRLPQSSQRLPTQQAMPLATSSAEVINAARSSSPTQTRLSSNPPRSRPQRSHSTRMMGATPQRMPVQSSPRKVRSPLRTSEDHSPTTARSSTRASELGIYRVSNSLKSGAATVRPCVVTSSPLGTTLPASVPSAPSRPRCRPLVTSPERWTSPERQNSPEQCVHPIVSPPATALLDLPLAATRAPACGTMLPTRSPHSNGFLETNCSSGCDYCGVGAAPACLAAHAHSTFLQRPSVSVQSTTPATPQSPPFIRPGVKMVGTPSSPFPKVPTFFLSTEVGACSLKGLKVGNPHWTNQDTELVLRLSDELLLVAVFDGHGENGRIISLRVQEIVEQFAQTFLVQNKTPLDGAFAQLFALAQSVLEREGLSRLSGTTATIALINQATATMAVAHVGDSKLMVVRDEKVTFETEDHIIDDEEERRVVECGGEVRELPGAANAGVRRVFIPGQPLPGLAMARSLGDLEAHRLGALSEPTVTTDIKLKARSIVIVASDGLWDRLPREFVMANVALAKPEQSAHAMAFAARARWPPEGDIDDITAVVVQLCANEDSLGNSAR